MWALLLSSFAAPVFFRRVLAKQEKAAHIHTSRTFGDDLHASNHSQSREREGAGGCVVTAAVR